jgi:CubicO group peptidase (beta-lactamase class C family)/DNA-directed RNA polymerase specialized sigma24 family protein
MSDVNDLDLVREYADRNSESAFAALVHRHVNLVYSVALRFTCNSEDAQDVTQAVFIILAQKANRLRQGTILTGWLYETTRFTAIKLVRTKTRQQAHERAALMQSTLNDSNPGSVWAQLAPILTRAASKPPARQKTKFLSVGGAVSALRGRTCFRIRLGINPSPMRHADPVWRSRKIARLWFLALILLVGRLPAAPPASVPSDAEIKAILTRFIERDRWGVGIVVGIVDEQGTRVISCGKMDLGDCLEVNGDTLFEVGSITKTFTTLLLEDMLARGEMKLDDPVEKYLPASVRVPHWGAQKITLQDLATHTSGLTRDLEGDLTLPHLYEVLSHCRLERRPGRKAAYSNLGVALLGHAIELKAGTNYAALLRDRICRPLDMTSTCIALPDELRPRLAKGHGQERRVAGDFADTMLALPGCGAIRSTANDMLKYVAANLGLKPSPLQRLMEETHAIRIPHAFDEADLAMPWWVYHRQAAELITHGGSTAGHKAFIGFDKAARRGVVLLSNREDNNEQAMLPLGLYLLHPPVTHPPAVSVAPEILDSCIGLYEFPRVPLVIMAVRRIGNGLTFQMLNGAVGRDWFPVSNHEFADPWSENRLRFTRGAGGRATAVFIRPHGSVLRAWRVSKHVPESLFQPIPEPLDEKQCVPRPGSDLQGAWDLTARLWYWPFTTERAKLRVAELSPGLFRAEFDFPRFQAGNLPVEVIYHPPAVELITRSGAGMFKGKLKTDHTKMSGHYYISHFSLGTTLRRAR